MCVHNTLVIDCKTGKSSLCASYNTGELSQGYVIEHAGAAFHTSSHFFRLQEWLVEHDGKDIPDLKRTCSLAALGKIMYFDRVMSVYRVHTKGSWSSSVDDKFNIIADYMNRLSFYQKFDEETQYRYHENVNKISTGIMLQVCTNIRNFYRQFRFRQRFVLLLGWFVDCFGLYPLRAWIREKTGL